MHLAATVILAFIPLVACNGLERRQTKTPLEASFIRECFDITYRYQCEESSYSQDAANVALKCGSAYLPFAEHYAAQCTRGDGGKFKGQFCFHLFTESTDYLMLGTECALVTNSTSSCTTGCRDLLQSLVSELGCCFRTVFNELLYELLVGNSISVTLEACNVVASTLCDTSFEVTVPDNADSCTPSEFWGRLGNYICRTDINQPVYDALLKNPNCVPLARHYANSCGLGTNNTFCVTLLETSFDPMNVTRAVSRSPVLNAAVESCANYSSFKTENCPLSCQNALNVAINKFGCCINLLNDSVNEVFLPHFSGEVATSCGIQSAGVCKSNLQLNGSTVVTATIFWIYILSLALLLDLTV